MRLAKQKLFDYYFPIEKSAELTVEEKKPIMIEWHATPPCTFATAAIPYCGPELYPTWKLHGHRTQVRQVERCTSRQRIPSFGFALRRHHSTRPRRAGAARCANGAVPLSVSYDIVACVSLALYLHLHVFRAGSALQPRLSAVTCRSSSSRLGSETCG
eukprot:SAG11_NODE_1928_length_4053_cov_6.814112_2_plen_158_part_00